MYSIDELFKVIEVGLSQLGIENKTFNVRKIYLLNDQTIACDFYTHARESVEIKREICSIMGYFSRFFSEELEKYIDFVDNFAVRAYSDSDEEILYAMSSKEAARYIAQGKAIEWLKNTLFQDNSDDHRLLMAKRKISEIEIVLRKTIVKTLSEEVGNDWWQLCVDKKIKDNVSSMYKQNYGVLSTDGKILIDYTFLLNLRDIILDNWDNFKNLFKSKSSFKKILQNFNTIRRNEAHNRVITSDNLKSLNKIYDKIMSEISKYFPDLTPNYLTENWITRVTKITQDCADIYKQYANDLSQNKYDIDKIIKSSDILLVKLSEYEVRLKSIPIPLNKKEVHNGFISHFMECKNAYEDMKESLEERNLDKMKINVIKIQKANQKSSELVRTILLSE